MSQEINLLDPEIEVTAKKQSATQKLVDILQQVQDREKAKTEHCQAKKQVKGLIEALLFASSDPLSFNKIRDVTDTLTPLKPRFLQELIAELALEYQEQERGFELIEMGDGYLLRSKEQYTSYIERLHRGRRGERLSSAAAEVLAIVAYRQPITRAKIDAIRGVDSSGTLQSLVERQLIESQGRLEAPGRPTLYGTTTEFLKTFALKSLEQLPVLEES